MSHLLCPRRAGVGESCQQVAQDHGSLVGQSCSIKRRSGETWVSLGNSVQVPTHWSLRSLPGGRGNLLLCSSWPCWSQLPGSPLQRWQSNPEECKQVRETRTASSWKPTVRLVRNASNLDALLPRGRSFLAAQDTGQAPSLPRVSGLWHPAATLVPKRCRRCLACPPPTQGGTEAEPVPAGAPDGGRG